MMNKLIHMLYFTCKIKKITMLFCPMAISSKISLTFDSDGVPSVKNNIISKEFSN